MLVLKTSPSTSIVLIGLSLYLERTSHWEPNNDPIPININSIRHLPVHVCKRLDTLVCVSDVRYRGKAEFAHWYFYNETTNMKVRIDRNPAGVEGWLEQRIYYRKNGRYFAAVSLCKTQKNATEGMFKCKIKGDTGVNPLSVNIKDCE